MGDACVITLNGSDYYYPCDRKEDLVVIDNNLINVSSSTITLYSSFPSYNDNTSGYPRITCPTNTKAYVRQTYNNSNYSTLVVNSMSFKSSHYGYSVYIMIVILGVLICQLFKR